MVRTNLVVSAVGSSGMGVGAAMNTNYVPEIGYRACLNDTLAILDVTSVRRGTLGAMLSSWMHRAKIINLTLRVAEEQGSIVCERTGRDPIVHITRQGRAMREGGVE